jgi:hypothetical protein
MTTFTERVITRFGGITKDEYEIMVESLKADLNRAKGRAYEQGYFDANDEPPSGTTKSYGYERITSKSLRDISKMKHEEILQTVWSLWQSSPIAQRAMKLKQAHIVGSGAKPQTNDAELQDIYNAFWEANTLDNQSSLFALQLFLLGEQCYPVAVRESDGAVEIGYIDPEQIERVITHPDNSLKRWAVVTKQQIDADEWVAATGQRLYRIIQQDTAFLDKDGNRVIPANEGKYVTHKQTTLEPWENTMLESFGLTAYHGDVFYTPHNALSNQSRGVSDLAAVADWIDACEETLFGLAELEQFRGYFSWFVKLIGLDPNGETFKKRKNEIRVNPPKKGSVNITNDSEDWELKVADLKQSGSIETFRALLGMILGGLGFPVHWFGFGDDANKATATVQATPSQKTLEFDQSEFRTMLISMLRFVRDQAQIAGTYPGNDEEKTTVILPEINESDTAVIVNLLGPLASSLMVAIGEGWMTKQTAAELWAKLVGELGIEIDPAKEIETIAQAAADHEISVEQKRNDELKDLIDSVPLDSLDTPADTTPENLESVEGLNGAQISAVLTVLEKMSIEQVVPEAAKELLIAVGLSGNIAQKIVTLQTRLKPAADNDNTETT